MHDHAAGAGAGVVVDHGAVHGAHLPRLMVHERPRAGASRVLVLRKIFHNGMKNICLYLEADQRALITGHHGPAHAPARAEDVAAAELVPQLGRLEDQSEVSIVVVWANES